jgi:hypothetical protein
MRGVPPCPEKHRASAPVRLPAAVFRILGRRKKRPENLRQGGGEILGDKAGPGDLRRRAVEPDA